VFIGQRGESAPGGLTVVPAGTGKPPLWSRLAGMSGRHW
jgi:hypothetical protein